MEYALQYEALANFKSATDKFEERFGRYRDRYSGRIEGLRREEAASVETILDLCARLQEEFDKWDFDSSALGRPYRNGKCAPCLKEYLTK